MAFTQTRNIGLVSRVILVSMFPILLYGAYRYRRGRVDETTQLHQQPVLFGSLSSSRLEQIVDAIPVVVDDRQRLLPVGFQWLDEEQYENVVVNASTAGDILEQTLFRFMKHCQIKCSRWAHIGHPGDGGWDVCFADPFRFSKLCLVYSMGMGGDWSFDLTMTNKYGCVVLAYDPSLGKKDHRLNPRLYFHNTGLGSSDTIDERGWRIRKFLTLLRENNHTEAVIDILKIDIDYDEWESISAMLAEPRCLYNVKQLMVEFHTRELSRGNSSSLEDLLIYWHVHRGINRLGFKLWNVWDNHLCTFYSKRSAGLQLCGCFNAYYINSRLL